MSTVSEVGKVKRSTEDVVDESQHEFKPEVWEMLKGEHGDNNKAVQIARIYEGMKNEAIKHNRASQNFLDAEKKIQELGGTVHWTYEPTRGMLNFLDVKSMILTVK